MGETFGGADRPVAWTVLVLNRGWGGRDLLPEARRWADEGDGAVMLVYVVGLRRRPRRLWLWQGRRVLRRALGEGGPARATSLTLAKTVLTGVALAVDATGGLVMIQLGDRRRDAELGAHRISRIALDVGRHHPGRAARHRLG